MTLTPVSVGSIPVHDSTWTEDVHVTPGIADLALDKIMQTRSDFEVTRSAVVAEVRHAGAHTQCSDQVLQSLLEMSL
jgi:hypothetical protein